ncbi:FAD-dependent oxidoreductase [Noviherbaspirillum sedimenti]|uniref:FAD-dependent oxidoreductase n=1 Tax=Noviherbaspirillum sedimenti TaxID=2320865 RepID=A0A3A3G208_9BURK|nr:FAD-dependent oxidoreductase [Noviherbaspirillum sedimenti]RJG02497.1 FAD-dependent oxidoreductase [Noviherbaspirillum sedimenti]
MQPIIIVGSGLAGYTVAREFRKLDATTPLKIVSRDCGSFYSKPMLSNVFHQKKDPAKIASYSAAQMAEQLHAEVLPYSSVTALDPATRTIQINHQDTGYQSLVLALGADQRRIDLAGDAAEDVLSVNDLADYLRFHTLLHDKRRVAILGAGLIGCEFANDLTSGGITVDLIDPASWPLSRFLPEPAGQVMADALSGIGVQLWPGCTPVAVDRSDDGYRLSLSGGKSLQVDLVLSAIGLVPRIMLAQAAGLTTARGIVTDACLRTSAEHVYAIGDCAEVENLLLPYVMPIMQCARALAKTLFGTPAKVTYPAMPVVVKTPAMPTVVAPPLQQDGAWETDGKAGSMRAVYRNADSSVGGFALLGDRVEEKGALLKQIAPWRI